MYNKIYNPETNKYVNIYSKRGKNIVKKYLQNLEGGENKSEDLVKEILHKLLKERNNNQNKKEYDSCVYEKILELVGNRLNYSLKTGLSEELGDKILEAHSNAKKSEKKKGGRPGPRARPGTRAALEASERLPGGHGTAAQVGPTILGEGQNTHPFRNTPTEILRTMSSPGILRTPDGRSRSPARARSAEGRAQQQQTDIELELDYRDNHLLGRAEFLVREPPTPVARVIKIAGTATLIFMLYKAFLMHRDWALENPDHPGLMECEYGYVSVFVDSLRYGLRDGLKCFYEPE